MAGEDRDRLTQSIMKKWSQQAFYVRFVDGNIHNVTPWNLQPVTLVDALAHVDDWKV